MFNSKQTQIDENENLLSSVINHTLELENVLLNIFLASIIGLEWQPKRAHSDYWDQLMIEDITYKFTFHTQMWKHITQLGKPLAGEVGTHINQVHVSLLYSYNTLQDGGVRTHWIPIAEICYVLIQGSARCYTKSLTKWITQDIDQADWILFFKRRNARYDSGRYLAWYWRGCLQSTTHACKQHVCRTYHSPCITHSYLCY